MCTVDWKNNKIIIIDKLSLPNKFRTIQIDSIKRLATAIKNMEVHGAPAIGAVAAYEMALAAINCRQNNPNELKKHLKKQKTYLQKPVQLP